MSPSMQIEANQQRMAAPSSMRPLVQSYVEYLTSQGYRPLTIRDMEAGARHLCHWLDHSGIAISQVDDDVIGRFARHSCHCPGNRRSATVSKFYVACVRKFVNHLAQTGVIHRPERTRGDVLYVRIAAYVDWIRQHRGLSENTIRQHRNLLGNLLPLLGSEPRMYDASLLRRIFVAESRRYSTSHMKNVAAVLRSYLRYLGLQGECSTTLFQAVPSIAHWTGVLGE